MNETLLAALRGWLPEKSWNDCRHLVRKRHVQINGNLCLDEARRLKDREVVKVHTHPLAPPPTAAAVKLVYVDDQIAVVNKPSGITSVRHAQEQKWPARRKQFQPTLDEIVPALLARHETPVRPARTSRKTFRGRQPLRELPPRPVFPVHRIDRETSGLVVFARTRQAEQNLIAQFKSHSIGRAYWAVAHGDVLPGRIESILVRDRGDGIRGSGPENGQGQRAVTHVRPLQRIGGLTLVECRLETGRTHQIRIHLSEQGHPLCGEKVYFGKPGSRKIADRSGAPRLALHAALLEFSHPTTNRRLTFRAELPKDLQQFVDRLRAGTG